MKFLWVGFIMALLLQAVPVHAERTHMQITPRITQLSVESGEVVQVPITITNTTNTYLELRAVVKNSCPASEKFGSPTKNLTSDYGIQDWHTEANIRKILTVPAQQTISYQATFQAPFSLKERTYLGCLWLEPTNANATSLNYSFISLTVGQPSSELAVNSLSYNDVATEAIFRFGTFIAKIANTGEATAELNAILKITDSSGALVANLKPVTTKSVLPKHANYLTFAPLEALPDGQLTATLSVNDQYGSTDDESLQFALTDSAKLASPQPSQQADATTLRDWLTLTAVGSIIVGAIIMEIHLSHPHHSKTLNKRKNSSKKARAK